MRPSLSHHHDSSNIFLVGCRSHSHASFSVSEVYGGYVPAFVVNAGCHTPNFLMSADKYLVNVPGDDIHGYEMDPKPSTSASDVCHCCLHVWTAFVVQAIQPVCNVQ